MQEHLDNTKIVQRKVEPANFPVCLHINFSNDSEHHHGAQHPEIPELAAGRHSGGKRSCPPPRGNQQVQIWPCH